MSHEFTNELPYSKGYFSELNPLLAKFLFTSQGYDCPDFSKGKVCQIAFGEGISIVLNAAASTTQWWGCEKNANFVTEAQNLADYGNIKLDLNAATFKDFAENPNVPKFDYIILHGVWSWISPCDQELLLKFMSEHLNIGGVVLISYHTAPGQTNMEPFRHMMHQFVTEIAPFSLTKQQKLDQLMLLTKDMLEINKEVFGLAPDFPEQLAAACQDQDGGEFVRCYLNEYWTPYHFSELREQLGKAGLHFVSSAITADQLNELHLSPEQAEFLESMREHDMYETCRDFIINRDYRCDFFANGARKLTKREYRLKYDNQYLILNADPSAFSYTMRGAAAEVTLNRALYEPILTCMTDFKPHSIGQIRQVFQMMLQEAGAQDKFTDEQIDDAINTLVYINMLLPANNPNEITDELVQGCLDLNRAILRDSELKVGALASPVLGGGYELDPLNIKLLQIVTSQDNLTGDLMVKFIMEALAAGEFTIDFGCDEPSDEVILKTLQTAVLNFMEHSLPLYQNLMIV